MNLQRYTRQFASGEAIFREGDPGDCAYIIEKGIVQIFVHNEDGTLPLSTLGPGDIFGEMAIIDGLPRSATALAMEDCTLSIVSKDQVNHRIETLDPIVRLLISILVKRVRNTNQIVIQNISQTPQDAITVDVDVREAHEKIKLESELAEALNRKEFHLEYQPIVDLVTNEVIGFEALLRWISPTRGVVRTDQFIEIAEQSSLIVPIGAWIIDQAFQDLQILKQKLNNNNFYMSINVSVRQFIDPHFTLTLQNLEQRHQVNPKDIRLEVTERIFQEGPLVLESIERCRHHGYSISLDDFGTGYSSLTSLFTLNVDTIKIDRTFVAGILKDPKSKAITQAVIAMAKELNLNIVAEGIEEAPQALKLRSLGCLYGQGYYYSHPIKIDQIIAKYSQKKRSA